MTLDSTSQWADIKKYEEILTQNPRSYCFAPLAELYRKMGLLDDAISTAQKGCALYPDFATGQMVLGCSLLDKGDEDAGRQALEKVVTITPDNLAAQRLLSQLYVDSGEYGAAEEALNIILSLDLHDTQSRLMLETLPNSSASAIDTVASPVEADRGFSSFQPVAFEGADLEAEEIIDLTDEVVELEAVELTEDFVPVSAAEPGSGVPLTTATMAELYVQQGFVTQAIGIYQELLAEDPSNEKFGARLSQLISMTTPLPTQDEAITVVSSDMADTAGATQMIEGGLLGTFEHWLDNIRRIKACRSKSA